MLKRMFLMLSVTLVVLAKRPGGLVDGYELRLPHRRPRHDPPGPTQPALGGETG